VAAENCSLKTASGVVLELTRTLVCRICLLRGSAESRRGGIDALEAVSRFKALASFCVFMAGGAPQGPSHQVLGRATGDVVGRPTEG